MIKVLLVVSFVCHVFANIDGTSFGMPADTHKTAFGAALPASSGLADEEGAQLQVVAEVSQKDEQTESINHVKEMFSNAFNSIKAQREAALAASPSPPTV